MNPYKVLGLEDNAPIEDCKRAFRRLSRKHHPDNNGDPEMFDKVAKAWQMIESGTVENIILVGNNRSKSLHHKSLFGFSLS